jgi:hypothetical protein
MRSRSRAMPVLSSQDNLPPALTLVRVTCLVRIAASVATWCSEGSEQSVHSVHSVALCVASALNSVILCNILLNKPLTPELNPSAQCCLTRFFTGDFASSTVHFVNICGQTQQMQQLFIQFINYVW